MIVTCVIAKMDPDAFRLFFPLFFFLWSILEEDRLRLSQRRRKILLRARTERFARYLRRRRRVVSLFCFVATRRRSPAVWCYERTDSFWQETVWHHWTDDWKRNLRIGNVMRMKKKTFLSLCRDLRPLLTKQTTRFRRPVGVMKKVAVALWRLSGTTEYCTIGHLFGVGRSTAHRISREVCDAIVELLFHAYIRLPSGREIQRSIDVFESICGFPQVAGAIDGTHRNKGSHRMP